MNSQEFSAFTANNVNLPEYNSSSSDADISFSGNGIFIVPTPNVPDRLNGISGYVIRTQNNEGKLVWHDPTQLGISLEDLSDVQITDRTINDLIIFDGSNWINQQIDESGLKALNGLSVGIQDFQTGTDGVDFNIVSISDTHTFNIPDSSATSIGLITPYDWNVFNDKLVSSLSNATIFIGDDFDVAQERTVSGNFTLLSNGDLNLNPTGIIPNSYTLSNLSIDSTGRITSISDGVALTSLNGLTDYNQSLDLGTTGSDFNITQSGGNTNIFNIPDSSTNTRGALTPSDWNIFNEKSEINLTDGMVFIGNVSNILEEQTMSGAATIANDGTLTLNDSGVILGDYINVNISVNSKGLITDISNEMDNGIYTLNGLNDTSEYLQTNNIGTDFNITQSGGNTNIFNIPDSSASTRGLLTIVDWNKFNDKLETSLTNGRIFIGNVSNIANEQNIYGNATINDDGELVLETISPPVIGDYTNVTLEVDLTGRVVSVSSGSGGGVGIVSINTLLPVAQTMITDNNTGVGFTDFAIISSSSTHTFNIPDSSASTRGLLTTVDWNKFNDKLETSLTNARIFIGNVSGVATVQDVDGDATISNTGSLTLKTIIGVSGSYTRTNLTVNSKGFITAVSNGPDAGILSINGITLNTQTFDTGISGTDFNISSDTFTGVHTFNIPDASISGGSRGLVTASQFNTFNDKLTSTLTNGYIFIGNGIGVATAQDVDGDATISNTGILTLKTIIGVVGGYTKPTISVDYAGRITSISSETGNVPSAPVNSVQFNNSGAFGGNAGLTWNSVILNVNNTITNTFGDLNFTANAKITLTSGITNAIELTSGPGIGATQAGNITIVANNGIVFNNGGTVNMTTGNKGVSSGNGGSYNIIAGTGTVGGDVNISTNNSVSNNGKINMYGLAATGFFWAHNSSTVFQVNDNQPSNNNYSLFNQDLLGKSYWGIRDHANIVMSANQTMVTDDYVNFDTITGSNSGISISGLFGNSIVMQQAKIYKITIFMKIDIPSPLIYVGFTFVNYLSETIGPALVLRPPRDTSFKQNSISTATIIFSTYSTGNWLSRVRFVEPSSATVINVQSESSGICIVQI
jgi:hypothetical protein